jgi:hypothetical protein
MRPLTKKQQQWLWFVVLWCGGLAAVMLLAHFVRLVIGLG